MELITTHVSADFDALASVLVARRLHPGAAIFFPGSREESVRRMLETRGVAIEELRQRDVDPAALSRIILCDVRQRDRLGVVPEWLAANPEVEVLAYDHHPDTDSDVAVRGGVVDAAVGATSTLLAEQLRERGMTPSAEEATLLLMGIYEDTGSLTYPTTSPRDLTAAAWLLAQGGDMAVVRRHAVHSLDAVHLEVLYRMTQELQVTGVHGYRVGVVTLDLDGFIDELAPLVSRCLELFELDLLFALFGEGDRLTIIARGDVPGVHLGRVLEEVAGGGGHETAAAGSRKGVTVLEAREELLARLGDVVPPRTRARDLMIAPFVSVPLGATVAETKALLVRHAINAAPVVEGDRAVGAVSRQLLDGALQHGMETRPVSSIMRRELEWVDPQAPAEVLAERMAGQHPRFILVGDRDTARAQGVVTRMDVLRHLHGRLAEVAEPIERRSRELKARRQRIGGLLRDRVPAALLAKIETAAAVARRTGARVYLVGGLVRDLLLGQENRDLDLVVEGDGLAFAGELAQALGGRLRVHEAFLTAVVVLPDGDTVDIATARSEFYRAPAALPEVRTSALRQDLYRRDFTINTLAIHLGPEEGYELIDYFGGQRDLKEGVLRVLHSLSFLDDPTRVLRAVRLAQRLDFAIAPETLRLIEVALGEGVFDRLSGSRLRDELRLLLDEPDTGVRALERLDELGVLQALHPDLRLTPSRLHDLRQARASWEWYRLEGLDDPPVRLWMLLLASLAAELPPWERGRLAARLHLPQRDQELLRGVGERLRQAESLLVGPGPRPHQVRFALAPLSGEETLLLMAGGGERVRAWVRRDLVELRRVELVVRGADLLAGGCPPGPWVGVALRATLDARLDGEIAAQQELAHASRVCRREQERQRPSETTGGGEGP